MKPRTRSGARGHETIRAKKNVDLVERRCRICKRAMLETYWVAECRACQRANCTILGAEIARCYLK
jgi:hypothetical protein